MVNATNKAALRAALDSSLRSDIMPDLKIDLISDLISDGIANGLRNVVYEWFLENWKDVLILSTHKINSPSMFKYVLREIFKHNIPNYMELITFMLQTPGSKYEPILDYLVKIADKQTLASLIESLSTKDITNNEAYETLVKKIFGKIVDTAYHPDLLRQEARKIVPSSQILKEITPDDHIEQILQESKFYDALRDLDIDTKNLVPSLKEQYINVLRDTASEEYTWSVETIERAATWYVLHARTPLSLYIGAHLLGFLGKDEIINELEKRFKFRYDFWYTLISKAIKFGIPFNKLDYALNSYIIMSALPVYFEKLKENPAHIALAIGTIAYMFEQTSYDGDVPFTYCSGCSKYTTLAYRQVMQQLLQLDKMPAHIQVAAAHAISLYYNNAAEQYLREVLIHSEPETIKPFLAEMVNSRFRRQVYAKQLSWIRGKVSATKYIEFIKHLSA